MNKNSFADRQEELLDRPRRIATTSVKFSLTYYGGKSITDSVPPMIDLTHAEELELWRKRRRSAKARNLLVRRYIPWAFKWADKYKGPRLEHDDAVSAANAGMMEAMERYAPKKGAFTTFSAVFIRRHLINALVSSYPVHVSDHIRKKYAAILSDPKAKSPLKPGEAKTIDEVFDRLTQSEGYDTLALMFEKQEDAPATPFESPSPADEAEESLLPKELRAGIREALTRLERTVIHARYYVQPAESFDALGLRLGKTKIRLREVHDMALVKLKRYMQRDI